MATTSLASKSTAVPRASVLTAGNGDKPPRMSIAASGSSGRRFCRIYFEGNRWVLHLQPRSWPSNSADDDCRIPFHTLSAAIAYAVGNGLSYRVLHAHPEATGQPEYAGGPTGRERIRRDMRARPES